MKKIKSATLVLSIMMLAIAFFGGQGHTISGPNEHAYVSYPSFGDNSWDVDHSSGSSSDSESLSLPSSDNFVGMGTEQYPEAGL